MSFAYRHLVNFPGACFVLVIQFLTYLAIHPYLSVIQIRPILSRWKSTDRMTGAEYVSTRAGVLFNGYLNGGDKAQVGRRYSTRRH